MGKNKIIIIILLVLVVGAVCYFIILSSNKGKNEFGGKIFTTGEGEEKKGEELGKSEEVLSLSGKVSSVNNVGNFLMVKPAGKEDEVKVIISEMAKLIKLTVPFDEKNPLPPGTQFTPKEKEIKLSDFKTGDEILVLAKNDITGKTEVDNITLVQILP